MPTEVKKEIGLEIGHVLFIDIVAYSKLSVNEQHARIEELNEIVRSSEQFRKAEAANRILKIPTGDGMALVFYKSPEEPAQCALEISRALKDNQRLQIRMGIHSGAVNEVVDVNQRQNVAGAGINMAQRVMDCGDAGHILVSKHTAEDLEQHDRWRSLLHDLGSCEVKHGVRLDISNLYSDEVGNPKLPVKLQAVRKHRVHVHWAEVAIGLIVLGTIIAGAFFFFRHPRAASAILDKSIAVLPFENLSSDKENAYFAEGIQDEILTRLAKIADLKVISRRSTQEYATAPRNLRDVGKQLGVANVLEGSVQKVANAVHVNVQLIRAATDEHLWAESYNRKLDDVFAVEGEVAGAVADQLNAKLSGAEQKSVAEKPTQNTAAYDAYLRGLDIDNSGIEDDWPKAAAEYAEAVRLDPNFANAWSRLAVVRSLLYFDAVDPQINSAAAVKEAADRALSLQPDSGEAFLAQAVYYYRVLRDFKGALEKYQQAQKRLPNSSFVLEQMAHVERRLGQHEVAEMHYRAAAQLDPRNVDNLLTLAESLSWARRYKESEEVLDQILEISPGNKEALAGKARIFQDQGRLSESGTALEAAGEDSPTVAIAIARNQLLIRERNFEEAIARIKRGQPPNWANDPRTITNLGYFQEWAGHKDEARQTFLRAITAIQPTPGAPVAVDSRALSAWLAFAYAGLNEKEKAMQQAQQALDTYKDDALARSWAEWFLTVIQARFGDVDSAIAALPHLLQVPGGETKADLRLNPFWDPLRNDPRFQKLCEEKKP